MKTALPWILAVLLGGGCFLLYNGNKEKEAELAKRPQGDEMDELRKENDELKRTWTNQTDELARLHKDGEELLRLRNETQQLQKQLSQLANNQAQAARDRMSQQAMLEKLVSEKEALSSQMQKLQEERSSNPAAAAAADACIKNLHLIDVAKQQWALDNKKTPDATPTAADLTPYIPNINQMVCPSGGTYTIGDLKTPPACSVPGHVLK